MLDAAERNKRLLAPFHNRRYEAHFQCVRSVIESGVLGEVQLIRLAHHHFTRRWDWQTLKEFGGGALNNYGSHLLDQALELVETDGAEIFSDLRNILSLGNTEDQIKILLRSKGGCLLDLEILPNAAYPQDTWLVTGTSGTLRGTTQELAWKYVDWSAHPERSASRGAVADRAYPSEQLDWKEDSWSGPPDFKETVSQFYADFYKAVRHEQPMRVTPESALKLIDLIETIRKAER